MQLASLRGQGGGWSDGRQEELGGCAGILNKSVNAR